MGFFKKIKKFAKKALPVAALAAPFIPGVGTAAAGLLKMGSGLVSKREGGSSTCDEIAGIRKLEQPDLIQQSLATTKQDLQTSMLCIV